MSDSDVFRPLVPPRRRFVSQGTITPEQTEPDLPSSIEVVFESFCPTDENDAETLDWVVAKQLGKAPVVRMQMQNGVFRNIRVAGHVAAIVLSSGTGMDESKTRVFVRLRWFPEPGKVWVDKLHSKKNRRLEELRTALVMAFATVPPEPGLVVRFVGAPPMSESDAAFWGYVWTDAGRAPVRCEISTDVIVRQRERAMETYRSVEQRWFLMRFLLLQYWKWRVPYLFSLYSTVKAVQQLASEQTPDREARGSATAVLADASIRRMVERQCAVFATPVMQSFVSLVWNQPDVLILLEEKGVVVSGTVLGTQMDLGDDDYTSKKPTIRR